MADATQWYTIEDGKQAGPWTPENVRERLRNGNLPADTLVWKEGFADWTPVEGVPELGAPPAEQQVAPVAGGDTHPWRRWFARMIDVSVAGAILGFTLGALGLEQMFANQFVAGFFALAFLALVAEPVWMAVFARTPGKWLLNISVTNLDSTRLDFLGALKRSVSVWARGLALGVPLISLFTLNRQYNALKKKGVATYDEGRHIVTHLPMSASRKLILFLVVLVLLGLIWLGAVASTKTG